MRDLTFKLQQVSRRETDVDDRELKMNAEQVVRDKKQKEESERTKHTNNKYLLTEIALMLVVILLRIF